MYGLTGLATAGLVAGFVGSGRVADDWLALGIAGAGMSFLGGHGFGLGVAAAAGMGRKPQT
jgi:hypothetical protein